MTWVHHRVRLEGVFFCFFCFVLDGSFEFGVLWGSNLAQGICSWESTFFQGLEETWERNLLSLFGCHSSYSSTEAGEW